jgi:transcriptional regulator with XRE-family HTH domain
MAQRADSATPNVTLYNLRDRSGASQQDLADAINRLAAKAGKNANVTANQVSRWERGVTRPSPFYRQLLSQHFDVSVDELGLSRPKTTIGPVIDRADPPADLGNATVMTDRVVAASQGEWRTIRRRLSTHRVELAHRGATLYDERNRLGHTGLLIHPDWLPSTPVSISAIQIEHDDRPIDGTGAEAEQTDHVRPLAAQGRRFHRYSQAVRILDQPRLFENRLVWCLQDVAWSGSTGYMSFGDSTYFDVVDTCEALAHETAANLIRADGALDPASWRGLALRRHIGDPFDLSRRAVGTSTDTLTIRHDRDGATFVLHERNPGNVAVAGGMLHVMPCGVFQPSSIRPPAGKSDFDLWRNIMREYSEELLGNPEHDGDGPPIDYMTEPFGQLYEAIGQGRARAFCLGVGLDALTLYGEILTVVVFDADVYDVLFADIVDANDEGTLIKTGKLHPTPAIPFTDHMIRELIDSGRMAPAGAACLQLAWDHRRVILGK